MKWYFLDYFDGYKEEEIKQAIAALPSIRKKEIYDAYYPNFVLKDDDYHVVSSNTISLIKALLLINRKKHILSNNKKQKTKTLTK